MRRTTLASSLISHSQMTKDCHPSIVNFRLHCLSLALLAASFGSQKASRDFGILANAHPACRCQKQPCTKITFRRLGKTKSGFPGRSERWRRKRYPRRWMSRRTANSGFVFVARMRDIRSLRASGVSVSVRMLFTSCCAPLWAARYTSLAF